MNIITFYQSLKHEDVGKIFAVSSENLKIE